MKKTIKKNCIQIQGARQNNLKNLSINLPLSQLVGITGRSGSGKSSLAFETLHAHGQRCYVETFSPYTRQFLQRLNPPDVDFIRNIRPSIATQQGNTVKTSRSTVGTMTELCDFFKVWFCHESHLYDPLTGKKITVNTPQTIWEKVRKEWNHASILLCFEVQPKSLPMECIFSSLQKQGYSRLVINEQVKLLEELTPTQPAPQSFFVIQDRLSAEPRQKSRFLEAVTTCLKHGQGHLFVLDLNGKILSQFSEGLYSPHGQRRFHPRKPAHFSFHSPLGACPNCQGFGRVIAIDYRLVIPDPSLSIIEGAIRPFRGSVYQGSLRDLLKFTSDRDIPIDVPWKKLSPSQQKFILEGDPDYGTEGHDWPDAWYGVKGFFDYLEERTYKMHIRVFLSRYRSYTPCPKCHGKRLQEEALCWKWQGYRLPDLYDLPVSDLTTLLEKNRTQPKNLQGKCALEAILTRLHYLEQVGLGYLTLSRHSRSLSAGEAKRVNLTTCLGVSLVDTLFVLDEPSVGLHPRDIDQLILIFRQLTTNGNTVVVVEHDETILRCADYLIELGPGAGKQGGNVIFSGTPSALKKSTESLTGAYLFGEKYIATPSKRRTVTMLPDKKKANCLIFRNASKHNIQALSFMLPLHRFIVLCGVSGSGKSTLLNNVLYQGLWSKQGKPMEDPASVEEIIGEDLFSNVALVDQSPVSRSPRSNTALYIGIWDALRVKFASSESAQREGLTPSHFSFNTGLGRCPHCKGLGYEEVEMQFLSDLYLPCPLCDTHRFKPEVLAVNWKGKNVAEILQLTVAEACNFLVNEPKILQKLEILRSIGLDYLPLGQPLNTLSGGESQRLKLVQYLSSPTKGPLLLLLDEPTTGLHREDVKSLLIALQKLVKRGHTLVVAEHHMDILKAADWILEIGPGAGTHGGKIVAEGPPETIASLSTATAPYLARALTNTRLPFEPKDPTPQKPPSALEIFGAREHNLKDIDVSIAHQKLTVLTGVSGSGKSSLAFDIVFAEGQRRFLESMSAYARQFVEQLPRPDIDSLRGIPPTVATSQRTTRGNRKSTVATITEVAPYLRLLYAKVGIQENPRTGQIVTSQTFSSLYQRFSKEWKSALYLCAPLIRGRKGHHQPLADWAMKHHFSLLRINGKIKETEKFSKLNRYMEHDIEVVFDDVANDPKAALERALTIGKGSCFLLYPENQLHWFSTTRTDPLTGEAFPELDPKHFSQNSPKGWCPTCHGYGHLYDWMSKDLSYTALPNPLSEGICPDCQGKRLNPLSSSVKLYLKTRGSLSFPELLQLSATNALQVLDSLELDKRSTLIVKDILPQIREKLQFMDQVGLHYLTLDRPVNTLSGGETQRIRLAAQLGTPLTGVLYVLDEPSIGLHAEDNDHLIESLQTLRKKGNTLLVVEHDEEFIKAADQIIDLGPGGGPRGGYLVASGSLAALKKNKKSITGQYLHKSPQYPLRGSYRSLENTPWLTARKVSLRNLKGDDLRLPIGRFISICGKSGAGKSTLIRDLLAPLLHYTTQHKIKNLKAKTIIQQKIIPSSSSPLLELVGGHLFKQVIEVDQEPIGRTPRSTPATYTGAFDLIRSLYASLPMAKVREFTPSTFSFNVSGGRCETCNGAGRLKLEMNFLPDTYVTCEACNGKRYNASVQDICWNGKNIAEVLQLSFEEAASFFAFHEGLKTLIDLMVETGLGYLTLGQNSPSLSGGEAQRVKLVSELVKGFSSAKKREEKGKNLYILEEPTTGLHLSDCEKLIWLLHQLVDQGHTVVVIEHHLALIAEADYVVELGPEGGEKGGHILYQGEVKGLLEVEGSPTAPYLRRIISKETPKAS